MPPKARDRIVIGIVLDRPNATMLMAVPNSPNMSTGLRPMWSLMRPHNMALENSAKANAVTSIPAYMEVLFSLPAVPHHSISR